jgi:probable HAF family extracellular repeat protein
MKFAIDRQMKHRLGGLLSLVILVLFVGWKNCQAAEFMPLGFFPDGTTSWARGVSDDGSVVVGWSNGPPGDIEAFHWTDDTGMQSLGLLPGDNISVAGAPDGHSGVSGDGSVIVGRSIERPPSEQRNQSWEAFVYTELEGMRGLGHRNSYAYTASFDGSVVVGDIETSEAFRWTEDEGLAILGDWLARDVSADGAVIVGHSRKYLSPDEPPRRDVVRWTAETGVVEIGVERTGGNPSVSPDGSVIAGSARISSQSAQEAFRWHESTGAIGLGWLYADDDHSRASGLNEDGNIIVGWSQGDDHLGFVWTEQFGMEELQQVLADRHDLEAELQDWTISYPQDISPNGQFITGIGINPDGNQEAWLVRLDGPVVSIPEPNAIALVHLGLLGMFLRRRVIGTVIAVNNSLRS